MKYISLSLALLLCTVSTVSAKALVDSRPPFRSFTLWQLPEQTYSQMMSYVIRTQDGKVIVIDGGMPGDAPYLRGFLGALGNHVDAWFITHPHDDHIGAITEILNKPNGLKTGVIYASMPAGAWVKDVVPPEEHDAITHLEKALTGAGKTLTELRIGQTITVDRVKFEVLSVWNPEIHPNPLNNSSVVLRVFDPGKSVLFLGDLGPEGGTKLLQSKYRSRLHADYVQMAHHGQNGVDLAVYKAIRATYCLWPTPTWLWENNVGGKGKGTGPWKTLEVRQWMTDMNVRRNYVSADGLARID